MSSKDITNIVENKIKALKVKREDILRMDPENALNEIIDFKENIPLVHSFPEQSLYMLMNEAGHGDFLPVLAMASKKQWEYIVDLEIWDRDEIDIKKASYWIGVLSMADPVRLANWLLEDQPDFLTYFLRNKIDVVLREHDEDPSIIGADFITFDDVIYFRVNDDAPDETPFVETKSLINDLLSRIAEKSYPMFQTIIFTSAGVITAEHAENLYRLRNSRLEGNGLLPLHEAIEIYSPFFPAKLKKRYKSVEKTVPEGGFVDESGNISSSFLMDVFSVDNYFTGSETFSNEFISLCNRIIVADKKGVKTRGDLESVAKRVSGTLKLGAEIVGGKKGEEVNSGFIWNVFSSYSLVDIFKAGNTKIREIREKVLSWQRDSWLIKNGFKISFLGEKWLGIVGGMLVFPAVYFNKDESKNEIYRPFNSLEEAESTEFEIEAVRAVDALFGLMGLKEVNADEYSLGWESFILTLWARDWLDKDEIRLESIEMESFKKFFDWLWIQDGDKRIIGKDKKQDFLNWLVRTTEIEPEYLITKLGKTFDDLFSDLEAEYQNVETKNLDAKFISFFLVEDH